MSTGALLLLLLPAFCRAASDPYAEIKSLQGAWGVDADCDGQKYRFGVGVARAADGFHASIIDVDQPNAQGSSALITYAGAKGRYRLSYSMPGNPVAALLGTQSIEGTMAVTNDPDDPDSIGNDLLVVHLTVGTLFTSTTKIKLASRKKAVFNHMDQSPAGKDRCVGRAVRSKVRIARPPSA